MSISEITGIPRATVIRKLQKLLKLKILSIDEKKHYRLLGNFINILKPAQEDVLLGLANFSAKVFNFAQLYKQISSKKKESPPSSFDGLKKYL